MLTELLEFAPHKSWLHVPAVELLLLLVPRLARRVKLGTSKILLIAPNSILA